MGLSNCCSILHREIIASSFEVSNSFAKKVITSKIERKNQFRMVEYQKGGTKNPKN